jgi:hypothetical protein
LRAVEDPGDFEDDGRSENVTTVLAVAAVLSV